jgi:TM2 domain-containing membrane protein YozV
MRGRVLGFDGATGAGAIAGDDGTRYNFAAAEWKGGQAQPAAGAEVDFDIDNGVAASIYPLPPRASAQAAPQQPGYAPGTPPPGQPYYPAPEKTHVVAGILALFFGSLGVHKFYLGYNQEGTIMLVGTIVSFVLCLILIGFLGLFALGIIAFVEAIIYLTKSEAEFQQTYVVNKRPWF